MFSVLVQIVTLMLKNSSNLSPISWLLGWFCEDSAHDILAENEVAKLLNNTEVQRLGDAGGPPDWWLAQTMKRKIPRRMS